MPSTEILPFATNVSANVESQAAYAAATTTSKGFLSGVCPSAVANKTWRQSSFMAAALAQAIVDLASVDVPDDGNLAVLITNLKAALIASGSGTYLLVAGNGSYKGYSGRNCITSVDGITRTYASDAPNTLVSQATAGSLAITGYASATVNAGSSGQLPTYQQAYGLGQSYVDETSSRVTGTTYTNSTAAPIEVVLTYVGVPLFAYVNGVQIYRDDSAVTGGTTITSSSFTVPPGQTYKITGPTASQWDELR